MEITLEKKDKVNAALKINLVETDYKPIYAEKLKEYGKKVQLKGFRPGKVPSSLVEKMYGKSILVEEINGIVSKSINDYLKDNKVDILGDPMPEEKAMASINWDTQKDFNFVYNLGLAPEFTYDLSEKTQITNYKITFTDKILKETLENLRKQFGTYADGESSDVEDIIYADVKDEAGKEYKAIIPQYRVAEVEKSNFVGLKIGQTFSKDARTVMLDDATIAHILGIDKKEAEFVNGNLTFTITRISKQALADYNEEFYAKVFRGVEIKSYEEFESKVKENIESSYKNEAKNALFNEIFDTYTQSLKIELPTDFLKNWLFISNEGKISKEDIEKEYIGFETGLKWDLLKNKIAKDFSLNVEHADVMVRANEMVKSQFGMMGNNLDEEMEKLIASWAENFVKKDNGKEYRRIFDSLFTEKVIDTIASKVKLKEEKVDIDKFVEIQKEKKSVK
ncbi:MAG: trigger factor [Bacteroidetes bacterium]|nr:MAG: trigger factor [Bacteroidota bacterium]